MKAKIQSHVATSSTAYCGILSPPCSSRSERAPRTQQGVLLRGLGCCGWPSMNQAGCRRAITCASTRADSIPPSGAARSSRKRRERRGGVNTSGCQRPSQFRREHNSANQKNPPCNHVSHRHPPTHIVRDCLASEAGASSAALSDHPSSHTKVAGECHTFAAVRVSYAKATKSTKA